jgi:hypothetical protein
MFKNRNRKQKRPFWFQFAAFEGEPENKPDNGGGAGGNPDPGKTDDKNKGGQSDEMKALQARLEAAEKKAGDLEKADKERKDAEEKAKMTAEEQRKAAEAEAAAAKRENLVLKARVKLGATDALYDDLNIQGQTQEEIEASIKGFQEKLEARDKANGTPKKNTPGGSTQTQEPSGSADEDIPTAQKLFGASWAARGLQN